MSVDAVTYRRAKLLTRAYGFVVNVGEAITGKEFSDRILSVPDRGPDNKMCYANYASKNIMSIKRIYGDFYGIKWRESK